LSELFDRCYENALRNSKIFSFHRHAVDCFNKNKHNRGLEFGRQFQIGRVGGNFVYSIPNNSIRMPDAASLKNMVVQHIETFQTPIESIGTDKGYYSKENEQLALDFGVKAVAIQKPQRKLKTPLIIPFLKNASSCLQIAEQG
jgi:transposase, IS5 family